MADLLPLDIDPAGDLALSVGSEEQKKSMRVSSKTLSLASPVLAAMLDPRFAEGQESGHKDWTVSLPDDDQEAMSYICLALHYQQDFNRVVSPSLLEKVAVLSDKYDFTLALRGSSELALQTSMIDVREPKTYTMLLNVSYALDGHQAFWKSTYWLLFRSVSVDDVQTSSSGFLLPNNLHGMLFPIFCSLFNVALR